MKNSLACPWTGSTSSSFFATVFFFLSVVVVVAGAPPSAGKAVASAMGATTVVATRLLFGMKTVEPVVKLEGVDESLLAELCADREAATFCMLKTFVAIPAVALVPGNTCYGIGGVNWPYKPKICC